MSDTRDRYSECGTAVVPGTPEVLCPAPDGSGGVAQAFDPAGGLNRKRRTETGRLSRRALIGLIVGIVCLCLVRPCGSAETGITENQVKALCLLNFAKYVTWPPEVFPEANTPLCVGVIGHGKLAAELENIARGKLINGRAVVVFEPHEEAERRKCHILFIGASGRTPIQDILGAVRDLPLLTVGEAEPFAQAGGIINFVKKENKVRFEVDLAAARRARLEISSKLLNLADVVRGKQP